MRRVVFRCGVSKSELICASSSHFLIPNEEDCLICEIYQYLSRSQNRRDSSVIANRRSDSARLTLM